jgi:hypothetical protein
MLKKNYLPSCSQLGDWITLAVAEESLNLKKGKIEESLATII